MPRRRSQSERRALVLAVGSVVLALLLLLGLSFAVGNDKVELSNLGDRDFEAGYTEVLAEQIEQDGPVLIPDASPNRDTDIYITHGGSSLKDNWRAIDAGPRGCTLVWEPPQFRDPCSGDTYPAGGDGLTRYETRVEGDRLYVDLRTTVEDG